MLIPMAVEDRFDITKLFGAASGATHGLPDGNA
jgi:hypothetical protein